MGIFTAGDFPYVLGRPDKFSNDKTMTQAKEYCSQKCKAMCEETWLVDNLGSQVLLAGSGPFDYLAAATNQRMGCYTSAHVNSSLGIGLGDLGMQEVKVYGTKDDVCRVTVK